LELEVILAKLFVVQNYELNEPDFYPQPPVKRDILPADALPISPNNPPWNGWTALGVWVASVIFISVLQMLFLMPYLMRQPLDFSDKIGVMTFAKTDPTAILLQLIAVIPAHLFTFVLAWLVVTGFRKFAFRETLGWDLGRFRIWHAFVMFAGFYAIALVLAYIFGTSETDFDRMLKSSRSAVFLVAFFATFTAPLIEEVIYRGLLYSAFQRRFGVVLAVIFVTVLFTVVHIPQYSSESIPNYASVIPLLLLSLTLTLLRVHTKNLLPCILLHTVVNAVQSVLLILQPYIENYIKTHQAETASLIQFFK